MWKYLTYSFFCLGIYAFYQAWKTNKDMWEAAEKVVQRAEKRGADAKVQPDGTIQISIDGQVVDTIPKSIS